MRNIDGLKEYEQAMKISMKKVHYEKMKDRLDRKFILNGCSCSLLEEYMYRKCENEIARCENYLASSRIRHSIH